MAQYESFNNSNNKLQKIWEKNEANTSEIDNNLSKFQVDFNSVNFTKKITTIPIFKEKLVEGLLDEIVVIDLFNVPEWIINHINIIPVVSLVGDTNTDTILTTLTDAKVGDIVFFSNGRHWMVQLQVDNYQLKIFLIITVVEVTDVPLEGNPTTNPLSFNLDLNLKIINPRIYETTNVSKK